MKVAINTIAATVTYTFEGLAPVVFNAARASAENRKYAEMAGWASKHKDTAALSRKQADGTVVTITEKMRRDEISKSIDYFYSGSVAWNQRGVNAEDQFILLVTAAIAAVKRMDIPETGTWIDKRCLAKGMKPKAYLTGMLNNADVQREYLRLRSEQIGTPALDADSELEALS